MFLEAIFAVLGFVLNGPGDTGVLGTILNVISPVPLFVVLGYAGYVMWSSAREAAEPSPMPAAQPA